MKDQIAAVRAAIRDLDTRLKNSGQSYRNPENTAWWFEVTGQEGLDRRTKRYEDKADYVREQIIQLWNVIATLAVCESMKGGK
jgi:hypothetical protein